MRKTGVFIFGMIAAVSFATGIGNIRLTNAYAAEDKKVYIGGMPAGFSLSAGGAQIIGISDVATEDGCFSPAARAGLKTGDVILSAAGIKVETVGDLNDILAKNKEKELEICYKRGSTEQTVQVLPARDKNSGRYKIGVLIRDSVTGIGTVTYIDTVTRRYGSLGHAVVGEDRKELGIAGGVVYTCSIMGVTKGIRGRAGELRGMFLGDSPLGHADKICHCGIYGTVDENYDLNTLTTAYCAEIKDVKIGKAYIYSTVNGVYPKKYSIEIAKVDKNNKENKNFVVKITDKDLLDETGGIVQGMSGSPIIQDGKIIGAITHVFLNDPTRGFGIDINTMLKE